MNKPSIVFILGAPRSGTSWLQGVLASLPNVATVPELHYFSEFAAPMMDRWNSHLNRLHPVLTNLRSGEDIPDRVTGLPASLEYDDLVRAIRLPFECLFEEAIANTPGLRLFIEKTPSNSIYVREIASLFPEAHFIHLVRDPRDVVRSLRAISQDWGRGWAPRSALAGALFWRSHVVGSDEAKFLGVTYTEIRYEDIRSDMGGSVQHILENLGMNASDFVGDDHVSPLGTSTSEPTYVLSELVSQSMRGNGVSEPPGFGDGQSARPRLGPMRQWLVELTCSDLMIEHGYELRYPSVLKFQSLMSSIFTALEFVIAARNRRIRARSIGIKRLSGTFD